MISIFKRAGLFIQIGHLKALLKFLGYDWNGAVASIFELFNSCKQAMYQQSSEEERRGTFYNSIQPTSGGDIDLDNVLQAQSLQTLPQRTP